MVEFKLFRLHVYPRVPDQLTIHWNRTRPEILADILSGLPSEELQPGRTWRITNIEPIEEGAVYFKIGRTKAVRRQVLTHEGFQSLEDIEGPHCHAFLDVPKELLAIAPNSSESPLPLTAARQVVRLLSLADVTDELGAELEVTQIMDPTPFLRQLQSAESVSRFWFSYTRPNSFDDLDEDLIEPGQRIVERLGGKSGKTVVDGPGIDPKVAERLTGEIASRGLDLGATYRIPGQKRSKRATLKQSGPAVVQADEIPTPSKRLELLRHIQQVAEEVRYGK